MTIILSVLFLVSNAYLGPVSNVILFLHAFLFKVKHPNNTNKFSYYLFIFLILSPIVAGIFVYFIANVIFDQNMILKLCDIPNLSLFDMSLESATEEFCSSQRTNASSNSNSKLYIIIYWYSTLCMIIGSILYFCNFESLYVILFRKNQVKEFSKERIITFFVIVVALSLATLYSYTEWGNISSARMKTIAYWASTNTTFFGISTILACYLRSILIAVGLKKDYKYV